MISTLVALLPCLAVAAKPDADLLRAVRSGDDSAAQSMLARHVDVNRALPDGSTLLAWAVESQNNQMVRLLLKHGAKSTPPGAASVNPLMIACQYGDASILDTLLSAGADVHVTRDDGIMPLSLCAGSAPTSMLARLIAAGAEVDHVDSRGQTPLMWAAAHGRIDNLQLLLKHGALINRASNTGFTPLLFALKSGDPQAPIAVLAAGGNADYVAPDGTSVVQMAMYQKDYGFAARLIERGANLTAFDRNGNSLLHAAVLANQPSLVKLLLAKGADANALTGPSQVTKRFEVNFTSARYEVPPKPPLILAAESGVADVMQVLVDAGADATFRLPDGKNIVLVAASSGKLAALALALQLQPDVNTTTVDGQTPLHLLVASNASPETGAMMKLLADKGARADIKNHAGKTPADFAKDAETEVKTAFHACFELRMARNP